MSVLYIHWSRYVLMSLLLAVGVLPPLFKTFQAAVQGQDVSTNGRRSAEIDAMITFAVALMVVGHAVSSHATCLATCHF